MKKRKLFFSFLISALILTSSNSVENPDIKAKIEKLIQEVKQAPPSERYKKMNQLKLFVKKLKAEERIKIMKQLHRQLHSSKKEHMQKMHRFRGQHREHAFGKDQMEMRNMKEKHKEHMKQEMHQGKHIGSGPHTPNDRRNFSNEKNKENKGHGWQWNHR